MATLKPNKPAYQSPLVQVNRIIAPEWLRWFNQIQTSASAVTDVETQLAALAALVAQDQADIATLQAQMAAVEAAIVAANAAIAALAATVTILQGLVAHHTVQLTAQQAEIDALAASVGHLDPTEQFTAPRDWTPPIEALARYFATLDVPRDWMREIEELRRYFATLDIAHDYSREIEDVRRQFALLDIAPSVAQLNGLYDPLGAAAAARAASDPLGTALLLDESVRDLTPQIEELRRQLAMLDAPVSIAQLSAVFQTVLTLPLAIASGGTGSITAGAARTALAVPGLATANAFAGNNSIAGFVAIGSTVLGYPMSIVSAAGNKAQLHLGTADDTDGYLLGFSGGLFLSGGVAYSGSGGTWIAKSTELAMIQTNSAGSIIFNCTTGVVVGTGYAITAFERMRILPNGDVLIGTVTDTGVDKLQVAGNIAVVTAGNGLKIKEGSNARIGTGTLVAGTLTVANTSVTANSRVFITSKGGGTNLGTLSVATSVGVSLTVTSTVLTDTTAFNWLIIEAL